MARMLISRCSKKFGSAIATCTSDIVLGILLGRIMTSTSPWSMVGRVEIDQVEKGMMATGRMGGAVGGRGGGSREGTLAGGEIFMSGNEKDFWVRTPYS